MRIPDSGILIVAKEGSMEYKLIKLDDKTLCATMTNGTHCSDEGAINHVAYAHASYLMKDIVPVYTLSDQGFSYKSDNSKIDEMLSRSIKHLDSLKIRPELKVLPIEISDKEVDELLNFVTSEEEAIYIWPECPDEDCSFVHKRGRLLKGIGPYSSRIYIGDFDCSYIGFEKSQSMATLLSMVE